MITAFVQINLIPADFDINREDNVVEIELPEMPRIGDQIVTQKTIDSIEKLIESDKKEYPNDKYWFENIPTLLTYVTNVVYGDNNAIYIGLSHNPRHFLCLITDFEDPEKRSYWNTLVKIPKIGEHISSELEPAARCVHVVEYHTGMCAIYTKENPLIPIVDVNEIHNSVNTNITNYNLKVEIDQPIKIRCDDTLCVNVKKFDYGYIYVKDEKDRY